MIKNSIMHNLTEIFENVEEKIKKIKNPIAKVRFVNDSLDWVKTLLDLLNKLKIEIEGVN